MTWTKKVLMRKTFNLIGSSPLSKFEQERANHEQKMAKMEAEMKTVFQQKVAEKETKLKQSEEEVIAVAHFSYTLAIVR